MVEEECCCWRCREQSNANSVGETRGAGASGGACVRQDQTKSYRSERCVPIHRRVPRPSRCYAANRRNGDDGVAPKLICLGTKKDFEAKLAAPVQATVG